MRGTPAPGDTADTHACSKGGSRHLPCRRRRVSRLRGAPAAAPEEKGERASRAEGLQFERAAASAAHTSPLRPAGCPVSRAAGGARERARIPPHGLAHLRHSAEELRVLVAPDHGLPRCKAHPAHITHESAQTQTRDGRARAGGGRAVAEPVAWRWQPWTRMPVWPAAPRAPATTARAATRTETAHARRISPFYHSPFVNLLPGGKRPCVLLGSRRIPAESCVGDALALRPPSKGPRAGFQIERSRAALPQGADVSCVGGRTARPSGRLPPECRRGSRFAAARPAGDAGAAGAAHCDRRVGGERAAPGRVRAAPPGRLRLHAGGAWRGGTGPMLTAGPAVLGFPTPGTCLVLRSVGRAHAAHGR